MKAMIFAAGLGTRLKPLTNNKPKALVEMGGITLLERCILKLKSYGITDVVINVHHFAPQVIRFIAQKDQFGINIEISDEQNALLNTGGGLLKAKELLAGNEDILITNVDILSNLSLTELEAYHKQHDNIATLVVRQRETSRYLLFKDQKLVGWKNIKTGEVKAAQPALIEQADAYAFSGIQIIKPALLNLITESGSFSIIDLYLRLAKTQNISAFVDSQSVWMDLGKIQDIEQAEELIASL